MPQQSVRFLPVSLFGAAMGLFGVGLTGRLAHTLLGWPFWIGEAWLAIGLVVLGALLAGYAVKALRHADALRAEWADPAQAMFAGALPIALTLAAGALAPYARAVAVPLWWLGALGLLAWQVVALARVLRGGIEIAHIHPGWALTFIGGIVVPLGAITLDMRHAADVSFAVSLVMTPVVLAFIVWRLMVGPPVPDGAKPLAFILIVPPAVIYINYPPMFEEHAGFGLGALYYLAWLLALALAWNARHVRRWPFTPAWWAFTFPLAGLAAASLRHLESHPGPLTTATAAFALVVANLVVAIVLVRALAALGAGRYLVPPSPPKPVPAQ